MEKISTRGAINEGVVVSAKVRKSAVVETHYYRKVPKYERSEKRKSKIHVHVPEGMEVREGDLVRFAECRKISKTKSHVLTEVIRNSK